MAVKVVGVDPGLVHTGVVRIELDPDARTWYVEYTLVKGLDHAEVAAWCSRSPYDRVFIEGFRPRSHYSGDNALLSGVRDMSRQVPRSTVLDNAGVVRIITNKTMRLLDVWSFPIRTHHQDLRSAARIALYGVVKDPEMNPVLAQCISDAVDGQPWTQV